MYSIKSQKGATKHTQVLKTVDEFSQLLIIFFHTDEFGWMH